MTTATSPYLNRKPRTEAEARAELWNRCDACGRFIALADFDTGAVRRLVTPDSHVSREEYETLCAEHAAREVKRIAQEQSNG